ncbi:hypothetical protein BDV40DRAFT_256752 [Aspergillus tamarii]|uniref:Zn(2)-C6 fungal-type domain-containing protein n=1 Tax=Aspergillus tamarii TaxID=41984 RepID=A0A5N6V5K5_ASPTM|nr:hypothetical protein BDV40DRAFT_256752 [Aspergillus tamarii]
MNTPSSTDMARHRACDACRERKVRCSRHTPVCERCSHFGLDCHYSVAKSMGRPPRSQRVHSSRTPTLDAASMSTSLVDVERLFEPMEHALGEFIAQLPPLDKEFVASGSNIDWNEAFQPPTLSMPSEGVPTTEGHYSPCVPHTASSTHASSDDGGTVSEAQALLVQQPRKCSCVELVSQHFHLIESCRETLQTLSILQQSTQSARRILYCDVCFGPLNHNSGISRNNHLLGSLMANIASSYGEFLSHQLQRATEAMKNDELIKLAVGQPSSGQQNLVELEIGGQSYISFIKASLAIEVGRLTRLTDAFAARQLRLHEQGHEACERGKPCMKIKYVGAVSSQIELCPRDIDPTKAYSCFRIIDQVRAVLGETLNSIAS